MADGLRREKDAESARADAEAEAAATAREDTRRAVAAGDDTAARLGAALSNATAELEEATATERLLRETLAEMQAALSTSQQRRDVSDSVDQTQQLYMQTGMLYTPFVTGR